MSQKPCVSRGATKRKLTWDDHAYTKNNAMINTIEEDPIEKKNSP